MQHSLLMQGDYVSIIKLVLFWALFFPSLPLLSWMHRDAKALACNDALFTGLTLGSVLVGVILWLLLPIYVVGLLIYVLVVGTIALIYVKQRNSRVLDFDKVLTPAHIKRLLTSQSAAAEDQTAFVFVTKNKNDVPPPEPRTPDFFGYRTAYDLFVEVQQRRVDAITYIPGPEVYKVTYEIDGAPEQQPDLPRDQMEYFVHFIKQLGDLDPKEKRKPQKGSFSLKKGKEVLGWEIRTAGSTLGEQIALRRLMKDQIKRIADIGLAQDQQERLLAMRQSAKHGIFIIAGPKGSGITTTFYAMLRDHDAYMNNIVTLEKETLGSLPSVTQEIYSLSDTATMTYANKLAHMIRMGPDIVGVAECNDQETAKTICEAAETVLVYVLIPADNVLQALGRWLKLVGDRQKATENLIAISCQRLLRKLCEECKQAYAPNQDILKKFNLPAEKAKVLYRPGKVIYDKRDRESTCPRCMGTGFNGRTGIFELILLNDALRAVIVKSKTLQEIGAQFRRAKMLYLQEQALRKVMAGLTAINEMVRVLTPATKKARSKQA